MTETIPTTPQTTQTPPRTTSKIPWYAGDAHCVKWPVRSPNSGYLSPDSGLDTQSLRDPGSAGYLDPKTMPKTEDEWKALFEMSFDDLVPEALEDKSGTLWRQRQLGRMELEKNIFSNVNVHSGLRTAPAFTRETRFHCRWVGPLYAMGTAVTRTQENEAVYEAILKDSKARQFGTYSTEFKLRVAEATTVKKAEELLASLAKVREAFEKDKDKDSTEEAKLLEALCTARLSELKQNEAAVNDDDASVTDEDEPAAEEVAPVVVQLVADDVEEDSEEDDRGKRRRAAPVVPKAVPAPVEFDPTGLSQEALQERLEKMARPAHVVSTLTVMLEEGAAFPFESITDPKMGPPVNPVFAHRLDHKGRGPYEQMTDKTMTGTLWTCSMLPTAQTTCKWRALKKSQVQIPCSFAGNGQEVLVVDHDQAYVIRMPKGTPTKELYPFRRDPAQPTPFKISHCQLSDGYACVTGFRPGNTQPLVLVYNRRKPLCTAIQTSIPVTSAVLSLRHVGHVLLGMKDGTILRVQIPDTPSRKGRPSFTLYHPVADKPDQGALKTLRKARGDFKIEDSPKDQDCVLHVGTPQPVTHLVERRNRIVASTSMGLHLFRLHFPLDAENRRFTMVLKHTVSYQWRGNVMVILKQDNSFQMMQIHSNRLEVTVGAPVGLVPKPPEMTMECSAISMSDQVGLTFL